MCAEQLKDYEVADGAMYMVVTEEVSDLDDVVTSFTNAYNTVPSAVMKALGMFAAKLNQEQIFWLLKNEKVKFVEPDGVVTIFEKKARDL
eukprot:9495753-Pyramimonas_sp.AAC.1